MALISLIALAGNGTPHSLKPPSAKPHQMSVCHATYRYPVKTNMCLQQCVLKII